MEHNPARIRTHLRAPGTLQFAPEITTQQQRLLGLDIRAQYLLRNRIAGIVQHSVIAIAAEEEKIEFFGRVIRQTGRFDQGAVVRTAVEERGRGPQERSPRGRVQGGDSQRGRVFRVGVAAGPAAAEGVAVDFPCEVECAGDGVVEGGGIDCAAGFEVTD